MFFNKERSSLQGVLNKCNFSSDATKIFGKKCLGCIVRFPLLRNRIFCCEIEFNGVCIFDSFFYLFISYFFFFKNFLLSFIKLFY